MILFLCICLNLKNLSFANWLESIQSVIVFQAFIIFTKTPLLILIFLKQNFQKINDQANYPSFTNKYGKLWENIRVEDKAALFSKPIMMFLKVFYVVDILLFDEGPSIQLYVAISIQCSVIIILWYLKPFDSRSRNIIECFYQFMTIVLMSTCIIYTFKDK